MRKLSLKKILQEKVNTTKVYIINLPSAKSKNGFTDYSEEIRNNSSLVDFLIVLLIFYPLLSLSYPVATEGQDKGKER